MCIKTVVRHFYKYLPKTERATAVMEAFDGANEADLSAPIQTTPARDVNTVNMTIQETVAVEDDVVEIIEEVPDSVENAQVEEDRGHDPF